MKNYRQQCSGDTGGVTMDKWRELTLEAVCSRITDGAHSSPPSVPGGRPMASVKDLTPFGIRLESCRRIPDEDFEKLLMIT
ncbi:MAG: hypothetical protein WDM96_00780 [Lacunisphaera sp.]